MNTGEIVKKYLELREFKKRADEAHKEKMQPYDAAMTALEGAIHKFLNETGQDNAKTPCGTAYKVTNMHVRMSDRETFLEFVKNSEDGLEFFTNAVAKEKIKDYLDGSAGAPPPGIEVTYIQSVNFRKA
jgi:hypothetical protein